MSRDPEEFERPELIKEFKKLCHEAGHLVIITSVGRTQEQQDALFAQGRHPLEVVNSMRKVAGYLPISENENRVVTWTKNSKHLLKPNGKCKAFDFAIIKNGRAIWSVKADVDNDSIPDYEECARIGESLGLVSGARFKHPDYPHFELPEAG